MALFDVCKIFLVLCSLRQQVFEQLFTGPGLIERPFLDHHLMLDPENHVARQGEDMVGDAQRRFLRVVVPGHVAAAFKHVGPVGGTKLGLSCDAVPLIAVESVLHGSGQDDVGHVCLFATECLEHVEVLQS
ncbi:hypothetical protein CEP54_003728 [Fusarium duplospermum]|uniref:Uncharacterized protein n=1 Tax=Fusarium duplospermum TaxID=1325734 RepID=A0A428QMJ8_9HYPO|nr:hypothetical protein CEP54_003728 [Fusarium duplospermum]